MIETACETDVAPVALIWLPFGRDAALAGEVLQRVGVVSRACHSVEDTIGSLTSDSAGVAIIAEEALTSETLTILKETLAQQPPWSDIPLILLTGIGHSADASLNNLRRMQALGNVTLLERPLRSVTLIAAVQSALASRGRQLQTRDYIRDLQEAQQNLAQANADLKQFAFAASHDLQEPLRMVNVFTQLLLERHVEDGNDEARQFAAYIAAGVKRMEALLGDLLRYSRAIHEGYPPLEKEVDLSTAIEDAISALRLEIDSSGAQITIQSQPRVKGDPVQLSLLFQNLISNAIKYAKPGVPPRIEIRWIDKGEEHQVEVEDRGIGFEPRYSERIFELFQRLNVRDDQNHSIPGTGLGLALCRRIVEKHGGRIWAESSPGLGSKFCFSLPALRNENG